MTEKCKYPASNKLNHGLKYISFPRLNCKLDIIICKTFPLPERQKFTVKVSEKKATNTSEETAESFYITHVNVISKRCLVKLCLK